MGYGDTSESCGCDAEVRQARSRAAFAASAPKARIRVRQTGLSRCLALFSIRVYQVFLGPFFGGACKFSPSCSKYAYEAIERFGARRGAWLAAKRVLRCRPFSKGGFDPVPEELSRCEDAGHDLPHGANPHDGRAVEVLR